MKLDRVLASYMDRSLEEHGINMSQMRFLLYLMENDERPVTFKEMEKHFDVAQPTVAGIMKKLERKEYITLVQDPHDRRAKNAILTDVGRVLVESQAHVREHNEQKLLECLSSEERDRFMDMLRRICVNMDAIPDATDDPDA